MTAIDTAMCSVPAETDIIDMKTVARQHLAVGLNGVITVGFNVGREKGYPVLLIKKPVCCAGDSNQEKKQ